METRTLNDRITDYLRAWKEREPEKWISGGELERLALSAGFKASNASRRAREQVNDGILERKEINGTVFYRFNW